MNSANHYEVLEVDESATQDQIKKAYRQLANDYHPDRLHPDDRERRVGRDAEATFKRVQEAYRILGDPSSREEYDEELASARAQAYEPDSREDAKPEEDPRAESRAEKSEPAAAPPNPPSAFSGFSSFDDPVERRPRRRWIPVLLIAFLFTAVALTMFVASDAEDTLARIDAARELSRTTNRMVGAERSQRSTDATTSLDFAAGDRVSSGDSPQRNADSSTAAVVQSPEAIMKDKLDTLATLQQIFKGELGNMRCHYGIEQPCSIYFSGLDELRSSWAALSERRLPRMPWPGDSFFQPTGLSLQFEVTREEFKIRATHDSTPTKCETVIDRSKRFGFGVECR